MPEFDNSVISSSALIGAFARQLQFSQASFGEDYFEVLALRGDSCLSRSEKDAFRKPKTPSGPLTTVRQTVLFETLPLDKKKLGTGVQKQSGPDAWLRQLASRLYLQSAQAAAAWRDEDAAAPDVETPKDGDALLASTVEIYKDLRQLKPSVYRDLIPEEQALFSFILKNIKTTRKGAKTGKLSKKATAKLRLAATRVKSWMSNHEQCHWMELIRLLYSGEKFGYFAPMPPLKANGDFDIDVICKFLQSRKINKFWILFPVKDSLDSLRARVTARTLVSRMLRLLSSIGDTYETHTQGLLTDKVPRLVLQYLISMAEYLDPLTMKKFDLNLTELENRVEGKCASASDFLGLAYGHLPKVNSKVNRASVASSHKATDEQQQAEEAGGIEENGEEVIDLQTRVFFKDIYTYYAKLFKINEETFATFMATPQGVSGSQANLDALAVLSDSVARKVTEVGKGALVYVKGLLEKAEKDPQKNAGSLAQFPSWVKLLEASMKEVVPGKAADDTIILWFYQHVYEPWGKGIGSEPFWAPN